MIQTTKSAKIAIPRLIMIINSLNFSGLGWLNELDYLTTHTSLSSIRHRFASG